MTQNDPTGAAATPFRKMSERFRGFLPVVVDVETGGFDWNKHALLEIAAIPVELDDAGRVHSRPGRLRAPGSGSRNDDRSQVAGNHPHRHRPSVPDGQAGKGSARPYFRGRPRGGAPPRLPARDPRRPQRAFRPELPQRRRRARRAQAQPVPSLQRVRHGVAGGHRLWADGAWPRHAGGGPALEWRGSTFGRLRRRTHRGVVLQDRQYVARGTAAMGGQ